MVSHFPQNNYEAAQQFSILLIANKHIRMISEGSCEDWSNDTENSALITAINYNRNSLSKYFTIYSHKGELI